VPRAENCRWRIDCRKQSGALSSNVVSEEDDD
jgi:hypothetical protein